MIIKQGTVFFRGSQTSNREDGICCPLFQYIGDLLMKKKLSEEEYNITYAALKLIENLFKQGRIKQHIFKNILDDYKESIDISAFKCYT